MKKYLSAAGYTICALGLMIWTYTALICASSLSPLDYVIQNGKPTQALQKLLTLTKVENDGSLQNLVSATQNKWLRTPGKELWEIDHNEFMNSDEIWDAFEELHLLQEVQPLHKNYGYLLFLGATYPAVVSRLERAIGLWNQGVRWKEFVLLGGARPVLYEKEIEPMMKKYGITQEECPKTEAEMMKLVYESMCMPAEMKACKLTVVDVPMLDNGKGGLRRPNTQDTIESWIATAPKAESCLAISSQPFIAYQHAVVLTYLPKEYTIETVGQKSERKGYFGVGTYFDTLARILYQENLRMNNNK